jgi:hypothetical protein
MLVAAKNSTYFTVNILIMPLSDEDYSRKTGRAQYIEYLLFYYYHWTDTSAGGLLVTGDIIPYIADIQCFGTDNVLDIFMFAIYSSYLNVIYLHKGQSLSSIGNLSRFWFSLSMLFSLLAPKYL